MYKTIKTIGGVRLINVDAALIITPVDEKGEYSPTPTHTQYVFPGLVVTALLAPDRAPMPKGVRWPWPAADEEAETAD